MKINAYKYLTLPMVALVALYSKQGKPSDYFDPSLIEGFSEHNKLVDLSVFSEEGGQIPGVYYTKVYLNRDEIIRRDLAFDYRSNDNKILSPLLTKKEYIQYGVRSDATSAFSLLSDDQVIKDISTVIPDAFYKYDFNQDKLEISIPQIYINKTALGEVSEKLWDDGVNALYTSYNYSGSSTKIRGNSITEQNSYLNLRSGINLGPWRLINYSTYNHTNRNNNWRTINTYLERNIASLKSQLTLGDSYTDSSMFDSFSFRGIKLSSDDAMIPSSQRGFAPVIRGIAQSNAEITIKQNDVIIRQSYVPTGPFEIDDLHPTGSSGDLEVTIKEANGTVRTFSQPFASVPIMQREGRVKYTLISGQYRNFSHKGKTPNFIQPTITYGLPYDTTIYSGAILAKDYKSVLMGLGKSLADFGSISLDASLAKSTLEDRTNTGSSFRFQYSKDILATGTNFMFSSYRYSTLNYREFSDVNNYSYYNWKYNQNKKDKLQFNVSQTLGNIFGNLNITGYQERYWNRAGKSLILNASYNNSYNGISYFLGYNYTKDSSYKTRSQLFSLSVSIPLDKFLSTSSLNLSTSVDNENRTNTNAGISGNLLDDNTLSYNFQTSYASKTQNNSSSSAYIAYNARFGEYRLGYNYNHDEKQLNYTANGSIIVHPHGITLGQQLNETAILVRAKDVNNVRITSKTGVYTDWLGNAIVPYSSPYEKNTISLDTANINKHADLLESVKVVIPTRGAIAFVNFPTQIGYKVLVKLNGSIIPFGSSAQVINGTNTSNGIVDDEQSVYLSGVPAHGDIHVSWANGQCTAPYKLSDLDAEINLLSITCSE